MKIARLRNKGELELKNEIIEYPPELEGGRNLIKSTDELHTWEGIINVRTSGGAFVYTSSVYRFATYQIEVRAVSESMAGVVFGWQWSSRLQGEGVTLSNEWQRVVSPLFDIASGAIGLRVLSGMGEIELRNIKAEDGIKATPYTPSPESLGLDYPDFIKKFNQKIYPHGVILTPEIIEFPIELVGKRNLFSGEFYRDINNYDDVLVYRYHLTNLKSNKRYAVRSWLKEGETATSNFWITLTSGHPNPNNASANGGTYSHIISNGSPSSSQVLPRNNVPVYVSYYPPNADPSILDRYNISIQQLDSGYINEWNPAPYDLGVSYSEDISSFGIRPFGDMTMVSEIREIPSDLFGANRNLILNSNGNFKNQATYLGAQFTATENVTVPEWGTDEATRVVTSGGTHNLKLTPTVTYKVGVRVTYSIYVKNNSDYEIRGRFNGLVGTSYFYLDAGESRRLVATGDFRDNYNWFQRQFWTIDSVDQVIDICLWREKLELGDHVTDWTPAPEDLGFNYPDEIQSF